MSGCSGVGGLDLGFKWTGRFRTVCYIEWEPYCQAVLCERMSDGVLDTAPIWNNFKTFDGRPWRERVDFFIAGIPCQPHSMAGSRAGAKDERNLWPDMRRIIGEMEPRGVLVENVPGLFIGTQPYGLTIVGELQSMGYVVVSFTLSAREVGARHLRNRRFIVGISNSNGFRLERWSEEGLDRQTKDTAEINRYDGIMGNTKHHGLFAAEVREGHTERTQEQTWKNKGCEPSGPGDGDMADTELCGCVYEQSQKQSAEGRKYAQRDTEPSSPDVPDTDSSRQQECEWPEPEGQTYTLPFQPEFWEAESRICRVVDDVPAFWVDRIKACGNAVVPLCAEEVAKKILQVIEK